VDFSALKFRLPQKRSLRIALFAAMALVLYAVLNNGVITLVRLHQDVRTLQKEITLTSTLIDSLKIEIQRLKTDTTYIERIARERLGMARSDETIYKFIEEK
jgi:cell division protein FtsB